MLQFRTTPKSKIRIQFSRKNIFLHNFSYTREWWKRGPDVIVLGKLSFENEFRQNRYETCENRKNERSETFWKTRFPLLCTLKSNSPGIRVHWKQGCGSGVGWSQKFSRRIILYSPQSHRIIILCASRTKLKARAIARDTVLTDYIFVKRIIYYLKRVKF